MSNINDYLLWRGDVPISKKTEFNEIDSMILARFSYLRFDKIKMKNEDTIESISNRMKNLDNDEFLYNGDKELITYLGQSKRFKDMLVTDYVNNSDKQAEKQFGAITVHISNKEMFISFIGTDSTVNGWKEDCNMAFMYNVPCQIAGKQYLEKVAQKYSNKRIRIGGHSKGGNVAVYSAITANKEVQDRIIKVDNYDGPGFSKNIISKYEDNKIINKIETFIPQDSIIGRMLNHKEKITITLSIEKGIYQHDIYSWQVLANRIIRNDKTTENSEIINQTINEWLANTNIQQRKIFIDSLFEIVYSTDANTFGDISKSLSTSATNALKKYQEIPQEDRKIMIAMMKLFLTSYMDVIKEKQTIKFETMKDEGKKKLQEFDEKHFARFKKKITKEIN